MLVLGKPLLHSEASNSRRPLYSISTRCNLALRSKVTRQLKKCAVSATQPRQLSSLMVTFHSEGCYNHFDLLLEVVAPAQTRELLEALSARPCRVLLPERISAVL